MPFGPGTYGPGGQPLPPSMWPPAARARAGMAPGAMPGQPVAPGMTAGVMPGRQLLGAPQGNPLSMALRRRASAQFGPQFGPQPGAARMMPGGPPGYRGF